MRPVSRPARRRRRRRRCRPRVLQEAQRRRQLRAGRSARLASIAQGTTPIVIALGLQCCSPGATASPATRESRSSSRPTASSPASMSRRSAPTRRIRTPPSSGWNTSTRTKASSAGSRATATRSASTTSRPTARSRRSCSTTCRRPRAYAKAVFPTLDEQNAAKEHDHRQVGCRRRRQRPVTWRQSAASPTTRPARFRPGRPLPRRNPLRRSCTAAARRHARASLPFIALRACCS